MYHVHDAGRRLGHVLGQVASQLIVQLERMEGGGGGRGGKLKKFLDGQLAATSLRMSEQTRLIMETKLTTGQFQRGDYASLGMDELKSSAKDIMGLQ